jgi:hypothetical protein
MTAYATPVRFTLADDDREWDGFTDGSKWNGFNNVAVTPAVRDAIVADLRSLGLADLDEACDDIAGLPIIDGLVGLDHGWATTVVAPQKGAHL